MARRSRMAPSVTFLQWLSTNSLSPIAAPSITIPYAALPSALRTCFVLALAGKRLRVSAPPFVCQVHLASWSSAPSASSRLRSGSWMSAMARGVAIAAASSIWPTTAASGPHRACICVCIHRICGLNHMANKAGPKGQPCWVPSCDSKSAHAVTSVLLSWALLPLGPLLLPAAPPPLLSSWLSMPMARGAPGPSSAQTKGSRRRSSGGASANRPGRRARWNWLKAFFRSICQLAKSGRCSSSALIPKVSFSADALMPIAIWSGPR